jgi:WD40 repeat protein
VTFAGGRVLGIGAEGNHAAVEVRDAQTGRLLERLTMDPGFRRAESRFGTDGYAAPLITDGGKTVFYAWAPFGQKGTDGPAVVDRWDLRSGTVRSAVVGVHGVSTIVLTDGGTRLVVVAQGGAAFVDAQTLRVVHRVPLPARDEIVAVAPDGRTIAVGSDFGTVSFVDTATGRARRALGALPAGVGAIAFSPTGSEVVTSADDGSLIVWNTRTAQVEQRLVGHGSRVLGIAFAPDGRTFYSCSLDGVIFKWDVATARRFGTPFTAAVAQYGLPDVSPVPPIAVSFDGSRFAARVGANRVGIFDAVTGRARASFAVAGRDATALAWSPTAPLVAATGHNGVVRLWEVRGAPRPVRRLRGLGSVTGSAEAVTSAAFSPDGETLAAGDVNHTPGATPYRFGTVALWNVQTGRLQWRRRNRSGWVNAVAFSADGTMLAASQEDGDVRIYRSSDGVLLRTFNVQSHWWGGFVTLAFGSGSTLATGTYTGIARLWNAASGAPVGRPTGAAAAPVASVAFDPTRPLLATTGGSDGFAKLWIATSSIDRFGSPFPIEPGTWGNAQFAGDGSRLIVLYDDGHGVIWPMTTAAWLRHACTVAGRNLTREEWARYVGGRAYEKTCG